MSNNADSANEVQLWKRFLNGDRNALSDLFRMYYKPLLNYGFKLIPQEDLIKDSIQELFFLIWERRDRLSEVEYVRSYLYFSLRRTVFRQAEIRKNRNKRDIAYSEEAFENIVSHEERMIENELVLQQKVKLKEALNKLSPRQREVVYLKFYCGLFNEEIAEVMGVNRQSVYNYMYQAIEALSNILDR